MISLTTIFTMMYFDLLQFSNLVFEFKKISDVLNYLPTNADSDFFAQEYIDPETKTFKFEISIVVALSKPGAS